MTAQPCPCGGGPAYKQGDPITFHYACWECHRAREKKAAPDPIQVAEHLRTRGVLYTPVDSRGRLWTDGLHIRHDRAYGPGWYIFARRPEYGGNYVRRVARPYIPVELGEYRTYPGWKRKKDAQAWCDELTALLLPPLDP